jgi:hypothetical protein
MVPFRALLTLGVLGPLTAFVLVPTSVGIVTLAASSWEHGPWLAVLLLCVTVVANAGIGLWCMYGAPGAFFLECLFMRSPCAFSGCVAGSMW